MDTHLEQQTQLKQIEVFFSNYSLEESRELLWLWLRATVTGNYCLLSREERDNLICFYEEITRLTDAVWGICQQNSLAANLPEGGQDA